MVNEATHFDREDFVRRRAPKHSAMWKKTGRIEFARELGHHRTGAGAGSAPHAGGNEDHVRPFQDVFDLLLVLESRFRPHIGNSSGAEAAGQLGPQRHLRGRLRTF